jgi:hypothetical protein
VSNEDATVAFDSGSSSARIPDRFRQHRVKLTLGEFLGLRPTGLRDDTTLSTGRAQAANCAGFRFDTTGR